MDPTVYEVLPWIAAMGFLILVGAHALNRRLWRGAWIAPAGLAAVFAAWSVITIQREGVAAVWTEHTRNAWGNQIWFDLLMAAGLSVVLLLPRARAAGMRPLPWVALVAGTGSIGLYAMLARCMFLEQQGARLAPAQAAQRG